MIDTAHPSNMTKRAVDWLACNNAPFAHSLNENFGVIADPSQPYRRDLD